MVGTVYFFKNKNINDDLSVISIKNFLNAI